jgi:hypothetical protein
VWCGVVWCGRLLGSFYEVLCLHCDFLSCDITHITYYHTPSYAILLHLIMSYHVPYFPFLLEPLCISYHTFLSTSLPPPSHTHRATPHHTSQCSPLHLNNPFSSLLPLALNTQPATKMPGQSGGHKTILLELKLIADVGLVGFPNVSRVDTVQ